MIRLNDQHYVKAPLVSLEDALKAPPIGSGELCHPLQEGHLTAPSASVRPKGHLGQPARPEGPYQKYCCPSWIR